MGSKSREQGDAYERQARAYAKQEFKRQQAYERAQKPHIPAAKRPRRIFLKLLLLCFVIIIAGAGFVTYKVYDEVKSIDTFTVAARQEPFELKDGATLGSVLRDLTGNRYYRKVLDIWIKLHGREYPVIQKGKYVIDGTKTVPQLLTDMREGNVMKVVLPNVALVEGMTLPMVVRRLAAKGDLAQDPNFQLVLQHPDVFIRKMLVSSDNDETLLQSISDISTVKDFYSKVPAPTSFEGLLMPATYEYEPGKTRPSDILGAALVKMATFMRDNYLMRDTSIDDVVSTPYDVLILASLVERESSLEEERPLIAGVFINRLKRKIRLQTDPAVMYGVSPDFRGPLRRSQLKTDTPYNTYTRAGLPPTPIAMPSESSILAVLRPAQTDAIFFVAKSEDPKDGHFFSNTLKEHNEAVKSYRQAVRDYKNNQAQQMRENNMNNGNPPSNIKVER